MDLSSIGHMTNSGYMERAELNYNRATRFPILGSLTAPWRALDGVIQLVAGAIISFVGLFVAMGTHNLDVTKHGLKAMLHGTANITRAIIEVIPFGGLALYYLWDLKGHRLSYGDASQ